MAEILPKLMEKLKKAFEEIQPQILQQSQKKADVAPLLEAWLSKAQKHMRDSIRNDELVMKVLKETLKTVRQNPQQAQGQAAEPQSADGSKTGEDTVPSTPKGLTSEEKLVGIVANFNEKLKSIQAEWDNNRQVCQQKIGELHSLQTENAQIINSMTVTVTDLQKFEENLNQSTGK